MNSEVCIVLATCNGAKFLQAQLDSIAAQDHASWHLVVADDESTDATVSILENFSCSTKKVSILPNSGGLRLGAAMNFSRALSYAASYVSADVFCLCDQDDVWRSNKLSSIMKEFGAELGSTKPVLVHHDLEVVNEDLRTIASSYRSLMRLPDGGRETLEYALTRNFVTGCASVLNRALVELALPVSNNAIMHDWWLTLVAALRGRILRSDDALVSYRQHQSNAIGAHGLIPSLWGRQSILSRWSSGTGELLQAFRQADDLHQRIPSFAASGAQSDEIKLEVLEKFISIPRLSSSERVRIASEIGLRSGETSLKLALTLRLLMLPKDRFLPPTKETD